MVAVFHLAELYDAGRGVEQDLAQAAVLFEIAAHFNPAARERLATAYREGRGVGVDEPTALFWDLTADGMDYNDAEAEVARRYRYGVGVEADIDVAIAWYEKSASASNGAAYYRISTLRAERGEYALALAAAEEAVRRQPGRYSFVNALAWTLATVPDDDLRDEARALALAEQADSLKPDDPYVLDTLGAAYAAVGRFEEAVATQERAIAALEEEGKTDMIEDFTSRLDLYRAGKPYRVGG